MSYYLHEKTVNFNDNYCYVYKNNLNNEIYLKQTKKQLKNQMIKQCIIECINRQSVV